MKSKEKFCGLTNEENKWYHRHFERNLNTFKSNAEFQREQTKFDLLTIKICKALDKKLRNKSKI